MNLAKYCDAGFVAAAFTPASSLSSFSGPVTEYFAGLSNSLNSTKGLALASQS
jgi:hypothetical protein